MKYRILGVLLAGVMLASCAGFQHTLATSGAAAVGAGVCGAAGGPGAAAVCAGAATVGTEILVPATEPLSTNPDIARDQINAMTIQDIWHWLVGGGVVLIIFFTLIGRLMPNKKQREMERMLFCDDNYEMRDGKVQRRIS